MSRLPQGISPKQTAVLYLLTAGSVVSYQNPSNTELREAIQLLEFYCGVPALGRAWRSQVEFKQPGASGLPNWTSTGIPGYSFGHSWAQPNEEALRKSVIVLLTNLFITPESPFFAYKPPAFRRAFAEAIGLDLRDLVECWRVVEKDFGLIPVPYDVRPRGR